ncbi:MAG: alpha/beta hydrolase [Clostridia bacterium]|nr:alpha/beta hydrolase [Clostridia bacterium]
MRILILVLLLALLLLLPGSFFYFLALRRRPRRRRKTANSGNKPSSAPRTFRMDRDWLRKTTKQDMYLTSRDGLQLHAYLLPQGDCRNFVVVCHGYRAHAASTAHYARHFYEAGATLLLIDARAHGESEGRSFGMGWLERLDVLDWIAELNRRYDHPRIVLFGVSMGGATVLNVAGEPLPENVKCIVSDCAYVSLKDEFLYQLRSFYHLPGLLLYLADPLCRLLAGYSPLRDGDGCAQLRRCKRPVLLIHGGADDFVPPEMLERAWNSIPGPKEKLIVQGAGHAESVLIDPARYWAAVDGFLKKYA